MDLPTTIPPTTTASLTAKEHVQRSIQANKDHQAALKAYTERLEAEIVALDKLVAAADINDDDEPDLDVGGFVSVPGSTRATAPVSSNELLSEESPFFEDAERRQRYLDFTGYHPMRTKELEDLAEAVRTENYRLYALQAQRRGQFSFADLGNKSARFLEQNKDEIDWERVASSVSPKSSSHVQRTSKECEIRWLGDRHPDFNHLPWSQSEIAQCKALVADSATGRVDWTQIAEQLGTHRTPLDCMRHGINRRTHIWNPETDQKLLNAVQVYGMNNWLVVARVVSPDATAQQCQNRFLRTLDPELKRGPWSPDEDAKLRLAVEAYENSWLDVALTIEGRNNEQCRDRWNEKLDPKINRDVWTEEEDWRLLKAVGEIGEGKWKAISETVGNGRKDSACRTRYETLKKRRAKGKAVDLGLDSVEATSSRPDSCPQTQQQQDAIEDNSVTMASAPMYKSRPQPRGKGKKTANERLIMSGPLGAEAEAVQNCMQRDEPATSAVPIEVASDRAAVTESPLSLARRSKPSKRKTGNEETSKTARPRKKRKTDGDFEHQGISKFVEVRGTGDIVEANEQDTSEMHFRAGQERSPPQAQAVNGEADPGQSGSILYAEEDSTLVTRPKPRKRGRPRKTPIDKPQLASDPVADNISVQITADERLESTQDGPQDELEEASRLNLDVARDAGPEEFGGTSTSATGLKRRTKNTNDKVAPTRKQPKRTASQKRT